MFELIFSILAFIALIISITIKERKKSLKVQGLNCFFEFIYNVLIYAPTAAVLCVVNIMRTIIFTKNNKFSNNTYLIILLLFESIILTNCIITWEGWISILPTIGTLFRTYALWQTNMKVVRVSGVTTGITYGLYYLLHQGYVMLLGDIVLILVSLYSIYINDYKNKVNEKIVCIDFNNKSHVKLLEKFYDNIYIKAFKNTDERETLEGIISQAKYFSNTNDIKYFCLLQLKDDKVVGGLIADYFLKVNSSIIEYIAIDKEYRGNNYASKLIKELDDICSNESLKILNKRTKNYCFVEIEKLSTMLSDSEFKERKSRIEFWKKKDVNILGFNYVQPAITKDNNSVKDLMLGVRVLDGSKKEIQGEILSEFLKEYFVHAFETENNHYDKICDNIKGQTIKLQQI